MKKNLNEYKLGKLELMNYIEEECGRLGIEYKEIYEEMLLKLEGEEYNDGGGEGKHITR